MQVPVDKSISLRALLLAALSSGDTVIHGLSMGGDVAATRECLAHFGVTFDESGGGVVVHGGLRHEPVAPLDHGNSGTGIRLMFGVCASQDMFSVLTEDQYLRQRPIVGPLTEMGAFIDGRDGAALAPLAIRGGRLHGITYAPSVASAQIKSSLLLAGINVPGVTTVVEPVATRRHTEDMLSEFGVDVRVEGTRVSVERSVLTSPGRVIVPGDPSQAAFWIVAGVIADDSDILIENLYVGFGRTGFVDALASMQGDLVVAAGPAQSAPAVLVCAR